MDKSKELPLFFLPRVLFPKMILPLHVFEERYKNMISDCLEHKKEFGILSDDDLDEGAVGTTATIYRVVKKYKDGRFDILALGEKRFHFKRMLGEDRFPIGEIEVFEDLPGEILARKQVHDLQDLYWNFITKIGLKADQRKHLKTIVGQLDIEREISYVIAQTIGLDTKGQRKLLAEETSHGRVSRLTRELNRLVTVHDMARDLFEKTDFDPKLN